jgi:hypothetical protein
LTLAIPQRVAATHIVRHRDRVQRILHARPHPDPLMPVQEIDKPRIFGELFETAPYRAVSFLSRRDPPDQEDATNAAAERIWPPHVVRLPAFSLLLGRTHLAIEPEPVVHAEHAERRARHGFSLPALHF